LYIEYSKIGGINIIIEIENIWKPYNIYKIDSNIDINITVDKYNL